MYYIRTKKDLLWDAIIIIILSICAFAALYPFLYVFSVSISDPSEAIKMNVTFLPKGFSLESYKLIIQNPTVWRYYYNTVWYTVMGVLANLIVTVTFAYTLSRKQFFLKKFLLLYMSIPMFLGGGSLIPLFLVINKMGLYNTRWALIIPSAMSLWVVVMTRVYFQTSIPDSVIEAAKIDGCSEVRTLWRIVIPLSAPIIAVVAMYNGVSFWNLYLNAVLFISKPEIQPLQVYLTRLIVQNSPDISSQVVGTIQRTQFAHQMRYSVIIFSVLPIVCAYPFLQKYFVKGVMVGSLKE